MAGLAGGGSQLPEKPEMGNVEIDLAKRAPDILVKPAIDKIQLEAQVFQLFHDTQLVSLEGTTLGINRSVLACSSSIFAGLLSDQDNLKDEQQFIITEINQRDLEFYIHFITTGTIPCQSLDDLTIKSFHHLGVDLNSLQLVNAPFVKAEKVCVTNSSGINHQEGDSKKETLLSARTQEPKYEVNANEYNFDNDYDLDYRDMVDVEIDEEDVPLAPPRKKKFKKANDDPTFDPKSEPISLSDTPKIHKKSANCKKNLTEKRGRGRPRKDHKGEACLNIHGLNDDYGKPLFENPSEYYYFPATGERDSKKEFHCHRCARSFEYSHQLTQHLYRHESGNLNQDKAWFCDLCDGKARFKSPMELIDHKSQSHDGYKKCDRCYGLIDLGDIQSKKHHKKLACDDATLFCVSCGLKTTHENNLKTHVKNHGGHEFHSNKCAYTEECPDVTFELWMDHLHHIRTKHNCIQKVKCKFCPESFFTDDEKKEHVRMTHKGNVIIAPDGERDTSLKFQCPRCIKGFEYKYLLNEHLLIHDAQAMAGIAKNTLLYFVLKLLFSHPARCN